MLAPSPPEAFRIGVKPLGDGDWLIVDTGLAAYLGEKARLGRERFGEVFLAEPNTDAAQAEVLSLVSDALLRTYPNRYRRDGDAIVISDTGVVIPLSSPSSPPLWTAAQLCQEDLVLMRRAEEGWRIAAAALCFPSAWRLSEKFGRPMHEIHGHVPDFGAGTRNDMMINRMFDNLKPDTPMLRWNWGLYGDDVLFHPDAGGEADGRFGPDAQRVFLRLERQTLMRLTKSDDIVFTIRIFVDPLPDLVHEEGGVEFLNSLKAQIDGFTDAQLDYKGLTADRARLVERLNTLLGDAA